MPNITNPDEPLDFNETTIKQLYLDNKRWDEVFPKQITSYTPAKLFTRPNGSGTQDILIIKFLMEQPYYKANTLDFSSAMLNLEPDSIGYSSFTGLVNYNYKYKTEVAYLLKWVFDFDSKVTKIFNKYGPRVELAKHENRQLKNWLDSWK
ncbi:MAG: hypothetical protein ACRC8P_02120 [Spiroplasma sp.]